MSEEKFNIPKAKSIKLLNFMLFAIIPQQLKAKPLFPLTF